MDYFDARLAQSRLDAYIALLNTPDEPCLRGKRRSRLTYEGARDRHKTITPQLQAAFLAHYLVDLERE